MSSEFAEALNELREGVVISHELPGHAEVPKPRERFQVEESNEEYLSLALCKVIKLRKTLVVMTGTPDEGKEEFQLITKEVGLEYRETPPSLGAAFIVQANISPGKSRIRRAIEIGIPVLSESDALLLAKRLKSS